ncbi:hypothetical protein [Nodosilinea sp. P-1105]|uniref:hypothetical protein n=1 Tax=Nodosilinea sp. P-1105 TaxID=2546229 RepID=UPI00146EFDE6|nr:hypothetical protein [Nodosilinea sp. P-1105]NMF84251.1 hypothetical protein [Nodosilinea sp. P-1105]
MTEDQKMQNQQAEQQEQVSDEQLENVAGGSGSSNPDQLTEENTTDPMERFREMRRENRDK